MYNDVIISGISLLRLWQVWVAIIILGLGIISYLVFSSLFSKKRSNPELDKLIKSIKAPLSDDIDNLMDRSKWLAAECFMSSVDQSKLFLGAFDYERNKYKIWPLIYELCLLSVSVGMSDLEIAFKKAFPYKQSNEINEIYNKCVTAALTEMQGAFKACYKEANFSEDYAAYVLNKDVDGKKEYFINRVKDLCGNIDYYKSLISDNISSLANLAALRGLTMSLDAFSGGYDEHLKKERQRASQKKQAQKASDESHNRAFNEKFKDSPMKILVVDDMLGVIESIKEILKIKGCYIKSALSGRDALSLLSKEKFDLMFTNLKMPEMDGMELLAKIKGKYPNMIIIMMSGYASEEIYNKAISLGAMEYLRKPFLIGEIYALVEKAAKKLGKDLGLDFIKLP